MSKLKIAFISPRPFGLMGTPGTYLLTESYSKYATVCIISNKEKNNGSAIVYNGFHGIDLNEINFSRGAFINEASPIIKKFSPDIIIIGNFAQWFEVARELKDQFPQVSLVLDIKSPLIVDNDIKSYQMIQDRGSKLSFLLDLVMTRCKSDVDTWIPNCKVNILEYPLGVRISDYLPKKKEVDFIKCRKFIYVGALHQRRKLDVMIRYIANIPQDIRQFINFHFYGSGPAQRNLNDLINELGIQETVSFKGYVDSETLGCLLPEYDAGVAWVPYDIYNNAPSLKLMEYLASGLVPVAMDTNAHQKCSNAGFHISFFSDSDKSFCSIIEKLYTKGFPAQNRDKNLEKIIEYDWDKIAHSIIIPQFEEIVRRNKERIIPCASSLYERVLMWDLPVNPEKPEPVFKSRLRVAGIVGDRLFNGLDPDCELFLLTSKNWPFALDHFQPDFLLIESSWFSATKDWYMAQTLSGQDQDVLHRIIERARKRGIPSVFWMTMDNAYFPHFRDIAERFDYVFCADPVCLDLFKGCGIEAELLLPAVQPTIFNPLFNRDNAPFNAGTLFNGWVDLFRIPSLSSILKRLSDRNLNIFQTRLMMYKGQLERTDKDLVHCVRGTVLESILPVLLRNADLYLAFEKSSRSHTHLLWDILEATASRVPVAWLGKCEPSSLISTLTRTFSNEDDYCEYVRSANRGSLELERDRQQAWRETYRNHVFAKRLKTICQKIGIGYDWEEYPKASLVTGTMRENLLPKCFKQFSDQTYPEKELILIFNGEAEAITSYQKQYRDDERISIVNIPTDFTVGTVLNYGVHKATGSFFFRVDDDDFYAPNYILDSLLYLRAIKAEVFGKRASFFHFEGEEEIYLRNGIFPSIKSFPASMLHKDQEYLISGCSFAASIPLLKNCRYPDNIQASVDTALVELIAERHPHLQCLLTDNLNMVVERAKDVSTHTWRIGADAIKRRGKVISTKFDELVC